MSPAVFLNLTSSTSFRSSSLHISMLQPLPDFAQSKVAKLRSNLTLSCVKADVISLITFAIGLLDVQFKLNGPLATESYATVICVDWFLGDLGISCFTSTTGFVLF